MTNENPGPDDLSPKLRNVLHAACVALDSVWVAYGVRPLAALAVEAPGGEGFLIRTYSPDEILAKLNRLNPAAFWSAQRLERARLLTSTSGWALVIPLSLEVVGTVFDPPGRYLAEEDLDGLMEIALSDQPVGSGGES